jgi:hypothetical protein
LITVCHSHLYRIVHSRKVYHQPRRHPESGRQRRRTAMGRQEHVDILRRFDVLYVSQNPFTLSLIPDLQTPSSSSSSPHSSTPSSSSRASSPSITSSRYTSPSAHSQASASISSNIVVQRGIWIHDIRMRRRKRLMDWEVGAALFVERIWLRLIEVRRLRGMGGRRRRRMIRRKSWDAGMFSICIVSGVGSRGE